MAGLDIALVGVNQSPTFEAPWGSGTGIPVVGFHESIGTVIWDADQDANAATLDMLFGQIPVASPGPQGLFYDVGVPGGATQPGENGTPAIAGFVPGNNVPWNFSDTLGDLVDGNQLNNNGIFEGGVLLASGTFDANTDQSFVDLGANAFVALGTSTQGGNIVSATLDTQIRTNAIPEPATLALLGIGLIGLATTARRRS